MNDYMVGGGRMGPVATAVCGGGSEMSGWVLMGLRGGMYGSGVWSGWIVVGLLVGAYGKWLVVGGGVGGYRGDGGDGMRIGD